MELKKGERIISFQLLDEVAQNVVICQWPADYLPIIWKLPTSDRSDSKNTTTSNKKSLDLTLFYRRSAKIQLPLQQIFHRILKTSTRKTIARKHWGKIRPESRSGREKN